jgi:septum formation topological specificity factor MinE
MIEKETLNNMKQEFAKVVTKLNNIDSDGFSDDVEEKLNTSISKYENYIEQIDQELEYGNIEKDLISNKLFSVLERHTELSRDEISDIVSNELVTLYEG